jgi:predicted ATP-dependent serine protease
MSTATMIIGESGTGKSTSLRNLDPKDVLLIQAVRKPLPFKSTHWKGVNRQNPDGSVFQTDNAQTIIGAMQRTKKQIIVIDDFQYVLANAFMRRSSETGFQKFTEIAKDAWDILMAASGQADEKRIYILAHSTTDDSGKTKAKTIGKLLDEKITIEGLLTIVLRTAVINGQYVFLTQNSGSDTTKSPMGMFADEHIPNDLAEVDKAICEFYGLTATA